MDKKVVLITGCSSGIGLQTAIYLQNKYHIIATARKHSDVQNLIKLGFESYCLDVADYPSIDLVFSQIQTKYPNNLYAVFNNAGFGQPGALEDLDMNVLKQQFETNVFGLFYVTKKAIEIFRLQGYGKIIQHSSILGLISLKYRGAYNASKYAIEGLCDTLRLELSNTNIYIITLNTGPITSKFRQNALIKFQENIDTKNSYHQKEYKEEVAKRLNSVEKESFFTKNESEVAKIVYKILKTKKPKARYHITFVTTLLAILKRFLPTKYLDKLLVRI